jgi:catechol 2,3-dioxygenase-like lactoylglutathione lyase family enzyme
MQQSVLGIHHVTAIASDPQVNLDFYTGILGLRLVKLTVNFDDPTTYHLYYGDRTGRPGTLLTFFPWPQALRGRPGPGQATAVAFTVPEGTLGMWAERLSYLGVVFEGPHLRYGYERYLTFQDPDGLTLELVAHKSASTAEGWRRGPVPPGMSIGGVHGVTLWENNLEPTASLLMDLFGFRLQAHEGSRTRFEAGPGGPGTYLDIEIAPAGSVGLLSAGSVHHLALTARDESHQAALRSQANALGLRPTETVDRLYFRSVYFREPGGTLLEVATPGPGFTVDEPEDLLGTSLKLPPWLEPQRRRLEARLTRLRLPSSR